jgi:poly-gamma-glutamate system protein
MKRLYWRPQRISLSVLAILAVTAAGSMVAVETLRTTERQPFFREKVAAANRALKAFDAIRDERIRRGIPIDPEADPADVGLIGQLLTPVTTNPGHLPAKQTSLNPNWAAVVVHLLKRAGVEAGDTVAVTLSGSFPAINVAVLCAMDALGLKPLIISSAGASQWGANISEFMWPDMEKVLFERRLVTTRSLAVSRGGIDDRALGLSKDGRARIDAAIERAGSARLAGKDYDTGVEERMALYNTQRGEAEVKAFINVGGGTTSVGTKVGKRLFKPGLNRSLPRGTSELDSIMTRMIRDGVPVIHLVKVAELAERYGLPIQPTRLPPVGEGKIFVRSVRNPWLAAGALALLIAMLYAFVRLDWGYRMLAGGHKKSGPARPEPMV